ncbi:MAG: tRNA(fMet)-specific endonuclease VapC [Candidatus Poribacteria bacterium]|nr:tRNA(fMet)-specific endonuclease VapC [Candidatus Poribacteria bacterium]
MLGDVQLTTSVIVRGELLFGVFKAEQFIKNLQEVIDFMKDIEVYVVDEETSEIYGKLKNAILDRFGPKDKSKRRNVTVESLGFRDNDVWIASTAIQHGLILVSADSDLLRLNGIEGLIVENW